MYISVVKRDLLLLFIRTALSSRIVMGNWAFLGTQVLIKRSGINLLKVNKSVQVCYQ